MKIAIVTDCHWKDPWGWPRVLSAKTTVGCLPLLTILSFRNTFVRDFLYPLRASYAFFRWFHSAAANTMVVTRHQEDLLSAHGFKNLTHWPRSVDTDIFKPSNKSFLDDPRPIWIYVGRVAVEKNIEAYLQLDVPGSKYVIGNGPAFNELSKKYKDVKFTGYKFGKDLARHIAAADVFVFPSKTDTFSIVMLEAMACGTPVAAYSVNGPIDVVENEVTGCLDRDLKKAALGALELDASRRLKQASEYTWRKASSMFLSNLAPVGNA